MFLIVLLFSSARILEAIRDAESFEKPLESRSLLWHLLKFPQFALIALSGYLSAEFYHNNRIEHLLIAWVISIAIAYFIFEFALRNARKYWDGKK